MWQISQWTKLFKQRSSSIALGVFCLMIVLVIACGDDEDKGTRPISILVFSKTTSFRHQSIAAGIEALGSIAKREGAIIEFSENSEIFMQGLDKFDVIVFLNTTGDILNDEQQLSMTEWFRNGGGFVGIHAATDTEYNWSWYGDLVGAYFNGHPAIQTASMQVIDRTHISTKHLPEVWSAVDEWYNFKSIKPGIKVLMNLDEDTYEGGSLGANHPITWYREFDGGRTWYTGMGHTSEFYKEEKSVQMLWGGIQYAAGIN